jgi:hypothetical protein
VTSIPAGIVGIAMIVAFPLAVEAGYRLHRRLGAGVSRGESPEATGMIVSSSLVLLGLLIGFTFAMSADRFETRRRLVVDEANAISTAWLRQQLFDEPERGRLGLLMRQYVVARQSFAAAGMDTRKLDADDARAAELQTQIWRETAAALRTPAGAPLTVPVLQATNEMFDLAASRRAAWDAQVPRAVVRSLVAYAALTAMIMGYGLAVGGRRYYLASSGLFVLVAVIIALIIDLDQPGSGRILVPQEPLDRIAAQILKG